METQYFIMFFVIFTKFLPSFCENKHKHRCSLEKIDLFWPVNRDQKVNHLDAALLAKKQVTLLIIFYLKISLHKKVLDNLKHSL